MAKDPAYSARSRLLTAGLVALLAIAGLFFLVAGLFSSTNGHEVSWFPVLLGLQLTVLGVLGVIAMFPSRRAPGPAENVDGGVALPLRRGYAARQALLLVVLGSLLLPIAVQDDNAPMVAIGSAVLVAGVAAALWVLFRGADTFRIRLTPDGLSLPSGWGTVRHFSWDEIEGAQAVPRSQPILVVLPKDDRADMGIVKLLAQGWTPDALTRVIDHYAENPAQRSELTSAKAVESVGIDRRSGS